MGVLADVDEPAGAGQLGTEPAGVDVAVPVDLGEAEEGLVEAAAVVEVEHARLVQDRLRVVGGAEGQSPGRDAADAARLDGERDQIEHAFLVGD